MFTRESKRDGYRFSAGKTTAIVFPLVILLVIVTQASFYSGVPYSIDQTVVHLTHAYKTNNISEKMNFMEETLVKLEPYKGNSGWMFPTEITDMEVTKRILRASIDEIKTELVTQDQSRWAFLPHNELNSYLNEQINDAESRIYQYARAYSTNPSNNPALYTLLIIGVGVIPLIAIIDHICNWRDDRIYFFKPKPEEQPKPNTSYGSLPKGF